MAFLDVDRLVANIGKVVRKDDEQVLLHAPFFPPNASSYTQECIATGWVSSAGTFVTKFEEKLADISGAKRAIACVNGTAALEIALRLAGVSYGDEVISPSLTFVATANAISHIGASPHFVDVCEARFGMCPESLDSRLAEIAVQRGNATYNKSTGRRIAAVCPMHCFGLPCEMDEIIKVCEKYSIPLIEDAAESLGSYFKGTHTGKFGALAALSFNGNKIITTGGGGAILTDDEELGDQAKHLTTTAKVAHPWEFEHDQVAWNFRMPNINAALGLSQLEILPALLQAKAELATAYRKTLTGIEGVELLCPPEDCSANNWLNCIILKDEFTSQRDALLSALNGAGIQSRPLWKPMHTLKMFAPAPRGSMKRTESLASRAINIPSSAFLAPGWKHFENSFCASH